MRAPLPSRRPQVRPRSLRALRPGVLLLALLFLAGCGRFTWKPAAAVPEPVWPQLGGSPARNAVVPDEPCFPLRQLWMKRATGGINPSLIGFGEWLLYATKDGKIEGFNLRSGAKPDRILGRNNTALTCAWSGDGLVLVKRLRADNLLFYDLERGRMRWQRSIGPVMGEPLVAGGRLYLATLRGRLLAIALEDGAILAEAGLPHDCLAAPAMSDTVLAVGDDRGLLHAFNSRLESLWQYETGGALRAPAVAEGGLFYIGSTSGRFSAIDAVSGAERWRFESPGKILYAAAVSDSLVLFASTSNLVYGLDRTDGRLVWQFDLGAVPAAAPLICGSTLFIGAANKKLCALSLADGRELWSFTAKGRISTSPVVFGGRLIFAAGYDYLYCFALR